MVYCCVPFCKSNRKSSRDGTNISFHEFPVDPQLSKKWLMLIARKNFVINDKSPSSVVCNLHFLPEDYVSGLKVKRLKKGTVPSVFPGYPSYMKDMHTRYSYKVPKKIKERKRKRFEDHPEKHGMKRKYNVESNASISTNTEENSHYENQGHSAVEIEDAELLSHFASKVEIENAKNESSKIHYNYRVFELIREVQELKSLLRKKNLQIRKQKKKIEEIKKKLHYYEEDEYHVAVTKLTCLEEYENSIASFLLQQLKKFTQKPSHG